MDTATPDVIPHGETGYRQYLCRCVTCTAWQVESGIPAISADPSAHGTTTFYRKGCRCEQCKHAKNAARKKGPRTGPGPGATHGKNSTYAAGCSCELCKAAHAEYKAKRRADQAARGAITHGTTSGYAAKCRCDECRAAHAQAARQSRRRARERDSTNGPYVLTLPPPLVPHSDPTTSIGAA